MVKSTKELAGWVNPIRRSSVYAGYSHCERCGTLMNPAERMLGPVCGKCVRELHRRATGILGMEECPQCDRLVPSSELKDNPICASCMSREDHSWSGH